MLMMFVGGGVSVIDGIPVLWEIFVPTRTLIAVFLLTAYQLLALMSANVLTSFVVL